MTAEAARGQQGKGYRSLQLSYMGLREAGVFMKRGGSQSLCRRRHGVQEKQHSRPVRRCLKKWDPEERVGAVGGSVGRSILIRFGMEIGRPGLKCPMAPEDIQDKFGGRGRIIMVQKEKLKTAAYVLAVI